VDSETRATDDDHLALRLWLRLLACTNLVEAPLRQRLREQFEGSLPRFDLMAQLDRHPGGLKMRELSRRLMVTGGNVTGLTDRLVAEGLVERREDTQDRRAFTVALTADGKKQFRTMARAHEGWVAELFGGLSPAQQAQLFELLGRLKASLPADRGR
jgi:DNA-binding MarR family transcriptional regulator